MACPVWQLGNCVRHQGLQPYSSRQRACSRPHTATHVGSSHTLSRPRCTAGARGTRCGVVPQHTHTHTHTVHTARTAHTAHMAHTRPGDTSQNAQVTLGISTNGHLQMAMSTNGQMATWTLVLMAICKCPLLLMVILEPALSPSTVRTKWPNGH